MHSNGMRTASLLTVSQHALGRVCVSQHALGRGGVYPSMHWAGGVCQHALGVSAQGRVCLSGGCRHPWDQRQTPPFRGQTDTCENITFANFICGR